MTWLICVGGPADGRWQDVPDGRKDWTVPIFPPLKASDWENREPMAMVGYRPAHYIVEKLSDGNGAYRFLRSDEVGSVIEAVARVFDKYQGA